ncbi:MAG: FmdB family zinc ribbon protein [bacterium]
MPIYEFICDRCCGEFEIFVRDDKTRIFCPFCGNDKLRRKVSNFSAHMANSNTDSSSKTVSSCSSCATKNCSSCGI